MQKNTQKANEEKADTKNIVIKREHCSSKRVLRCWKICFKIIMGKK
jgi:hypothetical protein